MDTANTAAADAPQSIVTNRFFESMHVGDLMLSVRAAPLDGLFPAPRLVVSGKSFVFDVALNPDAAVALADLLYQVAEFVEPFEFDLRAAQDAVVAAEGGVC